MVYITYILWEQRGEGRWWRRWQLYLYLSPLTSGSILFFSSSIISISNASSRWWYLFGKFFSLSLSIRCSQSAHKEPSTLYHPKYRLQKLKWYELITARSKTTIWKKKDAKKNYWKISLLNGKHKNPNAPDIWHEQQNNNNHNNDEKLFILDFLFLAAINLLNIIFFSFELGGSADITMTNSRTSICMRLNTETCKLTMKIEMIRKSCLILLSEKNVYQDRVDTGWMMVGLLINIPHTSTYSTFILLLFDENSFPVFFFQRHLFSTFVVYRLQLMCM